MPTRCSESSRVALLCAFLISLATLAAGQPSAGSFDPKPWLEDLAEIRVAMGQKYANLEWQVSERQIDLTDLFARAESRLKTATSDAEARAAIDRLMRAFGDGYVDVHWPVPRDVSAARLTTDPGPLCQRLGYDARKGGHALGPDLTGYEPLPRGVATEFPAGLVIAGGQRVGVLRIGLFGPENSPAVCASALNALSIASDAQCDDACADRVEHAAYAILSRDLASCILMLRKAGANVLLIDLTGNGGGSEWTEAAARMVSPLRLKSERRGFVRGEHWRKHWESLAKELRAAADRTSGDDKAKLLEWVTSADRARSEAMVSCPSLPFWSGRRLECAWLGDGYYATGLIGEADAAALSRKPWGALVFTPAEYEFQERVWRGPLLTLVDADTASAAEEFAAVLQDNKAAVVIGAPTRGAGCGHTDGGTPTQLSHSGGILELPDCARIRADGSNEVAGIDPDVLVGFRSTDGTRRKAERLTRMLPRGVLAAVRLCAREHCAAHVEPQGRTRAAASWCLPATHRIAYRQGLPAAALCTYAAARKSLICASSARLKAGRAVQRST
jgi:hypothetical protein